VSVYIPEIIQNYEKSRNTFNHNFEPFLKYRNGDRHLVYRNYFLKDRDKEIILYVSLNLMPKVDVFE